MAGCSGEFRSRPNVTFWEPIAESELGSLGDANSRLISRPCGACYGLL